MNKSINRSAKELRFSESENYYDFYYNLLIIRLDESWTVVDRNYNMTVSFGHGVEANSISSVLQFAGYTITDAQPMAQAIYHTINHWEGN